MNDAEILRQAADEYWQITRPSRCLRWPLAVTVQADTGRSAPPNG
jgi:hypothetical protein